MSLLLSLCLSSQSSPQSLHPVIMSPYWTKPFWAAPVYYWVSAFRRVIDGYRDDHTHHAHPLLPISLLQKLLQSPCLFSFNKLQNMSTFLWDWPLLSGFGHGTSQSMFISVCPSNTHIWVNSSTLQLLQRLWARHVKEKTDNKVWVHVCMIISTPFYSSLVLAGFTHELISVWLDPKESFIAAS